VIELEDELIRFSHPLLSSFLYAAAGVSARRRLHGKLAAVVSNPEERALHLGRAATGPDSSVASALKSAARRARARGAPDAALELTEEALRLTPPGRKRERAHLTLGAAEACVAVGDLGRARTLFERVVDEQPAGSLRARALMELARIVDDGEVATRMASQALAEAVDDLPLRMEIKRSAAMRAWATAQHLSIALTHARESLRLAEEVGDNDAYGAALAWVVRFEVMTGQPVRDEFRSHLKAPHPRGSEVIVNGLRYTWAEILLWSDELAEAREIFESLHRDAIARGDFHAVAPVLQILSFVLWRSGDWEAAHRCVEEAEQAARQCADETALAVTLPFRAWIEAQLGRVEAARTAAGEGRTLIARTHTRVAEFLVRAALGALELSLGQADAALGHLDSLASSRWAVGYRDPWWLFSVPDEVEALVMLGEPERAMMVLEPFERQAEALQRRWALGTAARCRGLLAAAAADFANASQAFERALEAQRRLGEPFELGRTLMSYGVSRRRAKQRHPARESLAESVAIFDQLGAALWAERARGELARVGGRAADADELTPTERRVAELVAGGRANKEAAAELFVSVKAVEANLSSIYRKLGIRSRTQLARLLTQREGRHTGGMS
jgi:DNA-binding CsgD family transcriptional regulator